MNYLWELMVKVNQQKLTKKAVTFNYPKRYSPYLELNFENINEQEIEAEIEINPYYRFSKIFRQMFLPDDHEDQELREILFDLAIHYISELDVNHGMTKRDYQISFFQEDIEKGLFGRFVQENYALFTFAERWQIAQNLLRLYRTNEGILLFKETIQMVYPMALQFVHVGERNELTIFLQVKRTPTEEKKIAVLRELFLPFRFSMEVYYEQMIGIIDEPAFMKMAAIVLF